MLYLYSALSLNFFSPSILSTHHGVPQGDEDSIHVTVFLLDGHRLHHAALGVDQIDHIADVAEVVVGEGKAHFSTQRLVDIEEALGDADDPARVLL